MKTPLLFTDPIKALAEDRKERERNASAVRRKIEKYTREIAKAEQDLAEVEEEKGLLHRLGAKSLRARLNQVKGYLQTAESDLAKIEELLKFQYNDRDAWTLSDIDDTVANLLRQLERESKQLDAVLPNERASAQTNGAPNLDPLITVSLVDGVWERGQRIRTLVMEISNLQDQRRNLLRASFSTSTPATASLLGEIRSRRTESKDAKFRTIADDSLIARIGVKDVFVEEGRFLERYIQAIESQQSGGTAAKTEDERKMDAAAQRLKNDIRFDVEQKLSAKLTTLEEIQRFQRQKSEAIKNDANLSYDEKTELLDRLRKDCEQLKNDIKADVSVYEED